MKGILRIGMALLAVVWLMSACDVEKEPYIQGADDEKAILKFDVDTICGFIDQDAKTVSRHRREPPDSDHRGLSLCHHRA